MTQMFNWNVGELPFIWTQFDDPKGDAEIPVKLPFELELDATTGVLKQKFNKVTKNSLEAAYRKGSVVAGVVDELTSSVPYVNDFLGFLSETLGTERFEGKDILEIGCGTGYLLSLVKARGANVVGIEPGEHALHAKEKYDVELIRDFFPSTKITGKFDVIILSLVLEHFVEPMDLLKRIHPFLKEGGKLVISVPNEEPFLQAGDLSSLFHEHYSYFTDKTLETTLNRSGFKSNRIVFGKNSGLLMSDAYSEPEVTLSANSVQCGHELAWTFKNKAEKNVYQIKQFVNSVHSENKTLGIYVPSRVLNFLSMLNFDFLHIRFFDDNPRIYHKYFPNFPAKIENRSDLKNDPCDVVLIFSNTFGHKIKASLQAELPASCKIISWFDLFESFEG